MTRARIIQDGARFLVIVTHPEAAPYSISCATAQQADAAAWRAEHQ